MAETGVEKKKSKEYVKDGAHLVAGINERSN